MAERRAELERKKAKLEAMKQERLKKEEERRKITPAGTPDTKADPDKVLLELGIQPAEISSVNTSPQHESSLPSVNSSSSATPDSTSANANMTAQVTRLAKQVNLVLSKVMAVDVLPKDLITYTKETQTVRDLLPLEREEEEAESVDTPPPGGRRRSSSGAHQHRYDIDLDTPLTPGATPVAPQVEIKELSEEEKKKITASDGFVKFVDKSVRIIERAMYEKLDILIDYAGLDGDGDGSLSSEGEKLKFVRTFYDESWTKNRVVTCLDWSAQFPELLLAAYGGNDEQAHDDDGVVAVWNTKFKKPTPEFIFTCQSPVMSACFTKFHPNLIVGGTHSGQVMLWDNRSHRRTPVQKTPLSATAHTHPICFVDVLGNQNAHNLVSLSTDGRLCTWNLDMLAQPQDRLELQHKQSRAVTATCCSFCPDEINNFVIGSEDGLTYTAARHGNKAGLNEVFEGHQGPVTGIDCNSVPGPIDFSPFFLTSSIDWTVKLWNAKENKLVWSFEDFSEYVYDVRWSPIHPALFATVDVAGRLKLWNLNADQEVPTADVLVEGGAALNKCLWHRNGHTIAAGDDSGHVHIYEVAESLATPRTDEWSRLVHSLQDIKNNRSERETTTPASATLSSSVAPLPMSSPLR